MTSNVIEFVRPRASTKAQPRSPDRFASPVPKLTRDMKRGEWMSSLAAIWANPANWRRNKKGAAFVVIDDLDICVVVTARDGGYQWQIRWRDGRAPVTSRCNLYRCVERRGGAGVRKGNGGDAA